MKSLSKYVAESAEIKKPVFENKITNESEFREWAESKFKEVFGEEYDEAKMKESVDGLLNDNKELVEEGKWDELVGMMNKSFAPKTEE